MSVNKVGYKVKEGLVEEFFIFSYFKWNKYN